MKIRRSFTHHGVRVSVRSLHDKHGGVLCVILWDLGLERRHEDRRVKVGAGRCHEDNRGVGERGGGSSGGNVEPKRAGGRSQSFSKRNQALKRENSCQTEDFE